MADLSESATWESGIRELGINDPVIGGPPVPATGAGMSNIPHLELANRTRWLRDRVLEGVAAWDATVTYTAGDAVQHSERLWLALATSTNSEPNSGNANWAAVFTTADEELVVSGAAGWRRSADGEIMQWASGVTDSNGVVSWTFPIAFPTDFDFGLYAHRGTGAAATSELSASGSTSGIQTITEDILTGTASGGRRVYARWWGR